MHTISELFTYYILSHGLIDKKDISLYKYGFLTGIEGIFTMAATLTIGYALGMGFKTFLYLILFLSVKKYEGGFHCPKFYQCFLCFNVISVIVIISMKRINFNTITIMILTIAASMILYMMNPVEHKNRRLDQDEKQHFKKRLRRRVLIFFCIQCVLIFFNVTEYGSLICMALVVTALNMMVGKAVNMATFSKTHVVSNERLTTVQDGKP